MWCIRCNCTSTLREFLSHLIHTNVTAGSFCRKSVFLCSALSHRNDIYMVLNCFPDYVALTNVIAAWIVFTGNMSLVRMKRCFYKGQDFDSRPVGLVEWGHTVTMRGLHKTKLYSFISEMNS